MTAAESFLNLYFANPWHIKMPSSLERAIEVVYPGEPLVSHAALSIEEAIAARRASLTQSEQTAQALRTHLLTKPSDNFPEDQGEFLVMTAFFIGAAEFSEEWHTHGFNGIQRVLEVLDAVPVAVRYFRLIIAKAEYDRACQSLRPGKRLGRVQLGFAREFGRIFDISDEAQMWDEFGPADLAEEYRRNGPSERHHARAMLSHSLDLLLIPLKDWADVESAVDMELREFIYRTTITAEGWAAVLREHAA